MTAASDSVDGTQYGLFDNISVQEEAGVDLTTNGSFTTNTNGWYPYAATASVESGEVLLTHGGGGARIEQPLTVVAGRQYILSGTARAGTGTGAQITIKRGAAGGYVAVTALPTVSSTTATTASVAFTAPGSDIIVQGVVYGSAGNTAYFDNISIREANNLVLNGTFDANTTGWATQAGGVLTWNSEGSVTLSNTSAAYGIARQTVPTVSGRTYSVSISVKNAVGNSWLLLNGQVMGASFSTNTGSTYQTYTHQFTATGSTVNLDVQLANVVGNVVTFDNIVVKDVTELVTNGTFEGTGDGWTVAQPGATSVTFNSGTATLTGAGTSVATLTQGLATTAGKVYSLSFTSVVDAVAVNVGTTSGASQLTSLSSSKVGENILTFTATGATSYISFRRGAAGSGTIDNISVKELTLIPVVTSYIPTTTAAVTRAADVYASAPGVRPDGYMDHWQSYDYNSGWVPACPAPAVELEGFTPAQAASAYAYGGGAYARHWLPQQMDATGLTVDINDPENLQGYIEAACMVAGPVWSPKYNASATSVSVIDRTEISRSAAGDQLADPGTISRKVPIDLRAMPEADRAKFLDLVRNSRAYPVLLSVFPEHVDLALERDFTVYGRRTKDSDIAYQYAGAYSTTLEIEEI